MVTTDYKEVKIEVTLGGVANRQGSESCFKICEQRSRNGCWRRNFAREYHGTGQGDSGVRSRICEHQSVSPAVDINTLTDSTEQILHVRNAGRGQEI